MKLVLKESSGDAVTETVVTVLGTGLLHTLFSNVNVIKVEITHKGGRVASYSRLEDT